MSARPRLDVVDSLMMVGCLVLVVAAGLIALGGLAMLLGWTP